MGAAIVPDKRSHFPVFLATGAGPDEVHFQENFLKRAALAEMSTLSIFPFFFLHLKWTEDLMAGAPAFVLDQEVTLRMDAITKMTE